MEVRTSCVGGDRAVGIESLSDWLRGEPDLAGRLRIAEAVPGEGELGAPADVLVVAVDSGRTRSVLATSLMAWLAQPRRSDVQIRVHYEDRETVEIAPAPPPPTPVPVPVPPSHLAQTLTAQTLFTGRTGRADFGVRDVAFSPDGRLLATGSSDGTARLWN